MTPAAATSKECFGRYVVLDEIGRGGMGIVYRARDPKLERVVALKVIHPRLSVLGEDAIRRFEREARAVAGLSHPGIFALHDIGEHRAGAACGKDIRALAADAEKATAPADKACAALNFAALVAPGGANLGAVGPRCGTEAATFGSFAEYRACLVRTHRCRGAAAVAWIMPRADALLDAVGQMLPDTALCD